jgi:hypothetical protein
VKIKTVIGLTGATAASLVGMAGLAASPAGAAPGGPATTMPAGDLPPIPLFGGFLPAGTFPNIKVNGNCPSWIFNPNNSFALQFLSGNAVLYRGFNAGDGFPNGGNAVGTAELLENGSPVTDTGQTFVGSSHLWFGQNANANGTSYLGETATFNGTAADGSTISFSVNPGSITSAGGHNGGWGQQNLSCNMVSAS